MLLIVSPPPAVPSTLMPLPSCSTSAGLPVVLDTALLPCSPLLLAAKETKYDCLCPDGCAPCGNVPDIAATLAAATIFQTRSASTDILLSPTLPSVPRTSSDSASCWQSKRIHTSRLDQFSKGLVELRISVVQQIAAAPQASPLLHSHVSRLLLHPLLIRVRREFCQCHLATLQVDEEQHIVGRQPFERQDFRREEVHSHQNVPVCADKVLPGDRLLSLRRWRNAVTTQDVAHRLIG